MLRDFEPGDLDASLAVVGDPEVARWLSFDMRGRAEQAERLAQDIARAASSPRPDYYLAIRRPDGVLIGFARLGLGSHRSGEVGYAVRRDRWGHGYATEAAGLLVDFGFRRLGLHRITAARRPTTPPPTPCSRGWASGSGGLMPGPRVHQRGLAGLDAVCLATRTTGGPSHP